MKPITQRNAFPYCRRCMPLRLHFMLLAVLLLVVTLTSGVVNARVPLGIFKDLGLTPQQIAAIDVGRPVVKVLAWGNPSEVYAFGAVHVKGSPETYLNAARDIQRLSRRPGYRGAGEIRDDATAAISAPSRWSRRMWRHSRTAAKARATCSCRRSRCARFTTA